MVTCWERAGLFDLMHVMFSCVFATFPCGVLDQVWYLIVSIPDLCLLTFIARIYGCRFIARTRMLIFARIWCVYCHNLGAGKNIDAAY